MTVDLALNQNVVYYFEKKKKTNSIINLTFQMDTFKTFGGWRNYIHVLLKKHVSSFNSLYIRKKYKLNEKMIL
uniref:Uncharacterized protein n=1 Tax=Lepeophtheirus salmonis TaxID=72036 RepID=A0A0K2SWC7_LEPSM